MLRTWIKVLTSPPVTGDDENANLVFILHSITLWGIPLLLLIAGVRIVAGDNQFDATFAFMGIVNVMTL